MALFTVTEPFIAEMAAKHVELWGATSTTNNTLVKKKLNDTLVGKKPIEIRALDGYKLVPDSVYTLQIDYLDGEDVRYYLTVSPDGKVATGLSQFYYVNVGQPSYDSLKDYGVIMFDTMVDDTAPVDPEPDPEPEYRVTQGLIDDLNANNTTLEWYDNDEMMVAPVKVGSLLPLYTYITFKANDGYNFVDGSVWIEDTTQGVSRILFPSYNGVTATNSVDDPISQNAVFNFETVATTPPVVLQYEVKQPLLDRLVANHVTLEWYDADEMMVMPVKLGSILPINSTITFTAIDGYKFVNGSVWIEDTTQGVDRVNFTISNDVKAVGTVPDVISENAVINFETVDGSQVDPEPDPDPEPVDPTFKGYNNVYKITDEQAYYFANKRFYKTVDLEVQEITNYIIGLIRLPFIVDESHLLAPEPIKIDTLRDSDGIRLNTDVLTFNMGKITIPTVKDNFLDLKNTLAVLHIPFSEPINLDINYVIGYEITVDFIINLYDGMASINVKSNKIDSVIDTLAIDLDINIPFANPETSPSNNAPSNVKFGIQNGVKIPYIEILRNNAILENGFFTSPIIDESVLNNQLGFIKVDEIELISNATVSEKNEIMNLLNSGVIIK